MAKIKSLDELKKLKNSLQSKVDLREKGENVDQMIQVKIAMATCGIASGAKQTMDDFIKELKAKNIENVVITQTGCMGYCHSEPTVEITLPSKDAVVFGDVVGGRVKDIVEKYIGNGELIDGIIPVGYKTVEE